jgi:hypothetical protein
VNALPDVYAATSYLPLSDIRIDHPVAHAQQRSL